MTKYIRPGAGIIIIAVLIILATAVVMLLATSEKEEPGSGIPFKFCQENEYRGTEKCKKVVEAM